MASAQHDVLWRFRWLIAGSCVVIAAAVSVEVATQAHRFAWALFAWGFLICLMGAAVIETAAHLGSKRDGPNLAVEAWRRRRPIYDGLWIFFGLVIGVIAAFFDLAVVDILTTVYIAITLGVGGILAARELRRRSQ